MMSNQMKPCRTHSITALGGALAFSFAWLAACSSTVTPILPLSTTSPTTSTYQETSEATPTLVSPTATARPAATATPPTPTNQATSEATPPPPTPTATFSNTELGITMQYPAAWQPANPDVQMLDSNDIDSSGQPLRTLSSHPDVYTYEGADGYFSISGASSQEESDSTVCEAELRSNILKQNRYGEHPVVEYLQIDERSACLIMPSDDQPQPERGRALLVWQHPDAAVRSRTNRSALVLLVADKRHIRSLVASLKFTGPWLQWVSDRSTPAPPAREMTHFVSDYGVSFTYPANWYTHTENGANWIMVLNAPAEGVADFEHGNDFRLIRIEVKPNDTLGYTSTLAYVDATLLWRLSKKDVLSVDVLPLLPQGYTAVRVTYLEGAETMDLYVRNGTRVVTLSTKYAPGRRSDANYLGVLDQIANTLVIP